MTTEERIVLESRLTEAKAAMHELAMGNRPRVVVDQNGERVENFAGMTAGSLRAYIMDLQVQLGLDVGIIGPLGFRFA